MGSYAVNGKLDLPVGFRFCPTDEELVMHYLGRKCLRYPLPSSPIPEFDVYSANPLNFPGDADEAMRYYFSRRRMNGSDSRWQPTGKVEPVITTASKKLVGLKRTLAYCEANNSYRGSKTGWFMHEFCFAGHAATAISKMGGEDWVVCSLFRKERKAKRRQKRARTDTCKSDENRNPNTIPDCIDFAMEDNSDYGPPPPPSPTCSEVAEEDSSELDQETRCAS